MDTPPKNRPTPPRRRKLLILSTIALTVLALALGLGLGLGLTLGRDSDDDNDDDNNNAGTGNNDGSTNTTLPPTPRPTLWRPSVNSTWQIVLQSEILLSGSPPSITPNVDIYDVDLFETPKSTITTLHSLGKKVICYFSAGSYEKGRPDAGGYEESDLGDVMEGWPDERWVRLGSESVRRVVKGRVELAAGKGCDAVDGDNVDGFVSTFFFFPFYVPFENFYLPPLYILWEEREQYERKPADLPPPAKQKRPLPHRLRLHLLHVLPLQHHRPPESLPRAQKRRRHHSLRPPPRALLRQRAMCRRVRVRDLRALHRRRETRVSHRVPGWSGGERGTKGGGEEEIL